METRTLKRYIFITAVLGSITLMARGQALPGASYPKDFQIGGSYTYAFPDYTPQNSSGGGMYATLDFTKHYGAEIGYHQVDLSQHSPSYERTYEFGIRYHRNYGPLKPYFKAMGGRGVFNFPGPDHTVAANEAYSMAVGGFGVDIATLPHINIRLETEYQRWFSDIGLEHGLDPILYNAGIAYHFNTGWTK